MNLTRSVLLWPAVFASGAASLVFETVWIRSMGLSLGSTLLSLSLVTALFFLGMAAGSALAARLLQHLQRPLVWYAVLELATGLWAVCSFPLLERSHAVYALAGQTSTLSAALLEAGVALLLLAPPAMAMGMSLPLLVGALQRDRTGRRVAALYAFNTLGAVAGALTAGLVLIAWRGLLGATVVGAVFDLLAAVLALLAAPTASPLPASTPAPSAAPRAQEGLAPHVLAATLGLVGMGYEVLYFRALHTLLMGTLETLSAVLATYLLGLVLGSALYHRWSRQRPASWWTVGALVCAQGALVLLTTSLLMPVGWLSVAASEAGGNLALLQRVGLAALVLLPVATLGGVMLPALVDACGTEGGGSLVGRLLAANTLGAVAGSTLIGAVLLPRLGTTASFYLLLLLANAAVLGIALHAGRRVLVGGALGVLLVASLAWPGVDMVRLSLLRLAPDRSLWATLARVDELLEHTIFAAEGAHGTVALVEDPARVWSLYIDGLPQASKQLTAPRLSSESVLLGSIPAAMARGDERALVIGLGGGVTVEALLAAGLASVDVVELEPRVVEALHQVPDGIVPVDQRPQVRLLRDDGRNLLQRARYDATAPRYDVIASQPTHWWLAGVGNLATDEFYRLVHASLADGGVYFQWINATRMTEEVMRGVVHSLASVFGEVLLFAGEQRGLFYLAGVRGPLTLDPARVAARLQRPELSALSAQGPRSLEALAALVVMGGRPPASAHAPRNRDRDALVETRLAKVPSTRAVDLSAMQPPLLDQLGVPPRSLPAEAEDRAAILLDAAERRLLTPAGTPHHLRGNLEGETAFGEVWKSVATLAVQAARRDAGPCRARYLDARLALLEGDIERGLRELDATCPEAPGSTEAIRATRLVALLSLERGACAAGLERLTRVLAPTAMDSLLRGMLQECAGQDPGAAYREALAAWSDSPLPGAAMRWAAEHAETIPPELIRRTLTSEDSDVEALGAVLRAPTLRLSPSTEASLVARLAQAVSRRRDRLRAQAQSAAQRGDPEAALRSWALLQKDAPTDLDATAQLVRLLLQLGRRAEVERVVAEYVGGFPDPSTARRELEAVVQNATPP